MDFFINKIIFHQGRSHAIGMCSTFSFDFVFVWNRTKTTADALIAELKSMSSKFKNPNVTIACSETIEHCVRTADVIVTATSTSHPLITRDMIKLGAHINGRFNCF